VETTDLPLARLQYLARAEGLPHPSAPGVTHTALARMEADARPCVGCFNNVRPDAPGDHSRGCPTGANGTPNYN
jgi:hypothetical protein